MTVTMIDLTCKQCGTAFTRPKSQIRQGRGGCCSRTCANAERVGKTFRASTRITRVCFCGKSFEVKPSTVQAGRGKTCSISCTNAARAAKKAAAGAPKPEATCPCGKPFQIDKPSRSGRQFCSLQCAGKANGSKSKPTTNAYKFGAPPKRQRPAPVTPRADDMPLTDGGSHVRCSGPCGQLRERGRMCERCEWRAYEGVAS